MICLLALALVAPAPVSASAQRRRSSKSSAAAQKKAAEEAAAKQKVADITSGKEKVALQIKKLSQFLYVLGGVNKTIERTDRAAAKRGTPEAVAETQASKDKVVESIRNVRIGLQEMEHAFQANVNLRKFSTQVTVSGTAQTAETQAAGGNFDEAGRTLVTVAVKLTDALAAIQ